jgi:hypothetical protein
MTYERQDFFKLFLAAPFTIRPPPTQKHNIRETS